MLFIQCLWLGVQSWFSCLFVFVLFCVAEYDNCERRKNDLLIIQQEETKYVCSMMYETGTLSRKTTKAQDLCAVEDG